MTSLILSERSKWLAAIALMAISSGIFYSVLTHTCDLPSNEVSHNYDLHRCKASEELGCRG